MLSGSRKLPSHNPPLNVGCLPASKIYQHPWGTILLPQSIYIYIYIFTAVRILRSKWK